MKNETYYGAHSTTCANPNCEGTTYTLVNENGEFFVDEYQPCEDDAGRMFYSGGVERKPFPTEKDARDYIAYQTGK